jgi:hypothetical protein
MKESKVEPATKFDAGKPRYDLIPVEPLRALADLYTKGALKYNENNWCEGMSWGRIYSAMQRHAIAWLSGETHDPVDGQLHLSSVAWCAFTLLWYEMFGVGTDDRLSTKRRGK